MQAKTFVCSDIIITTAAGKGLVVFDTAPSDAVTEIDDYPLVNLTPITRSTSVGTHSLIFRHPWYQSYRDAINVCQNRKTYVNVTMSPLTPTPSPTPSPCLTPLPHYPCSDISITAASGKGLAYRLRVSLRNNNPGRCLNFYREDPTGSQPGNDSRIYPVRPHSASETGRLYGSLHTGHDHSR